MVICIGMYVGQPYLKGLLWYSVVFWDGSRFVQACLR
jgi:hypothetical protein